MRNVQVFHISRSKSRVSKFQWLIIGITLLASFLLSNVASAAGTSNQSMSPNVQRLKKLFSSHDAKNLNLLFIQQAKSASLLSKSSKPGCYTLQLKEIRPFVLFFADQPQKITGHLSIPSFVYLMKNNQTYYNIKPNVAIEGFIVNGSEKEINIVLNLTNPVLSGNAQNMVVSYTACPLSADKGKMKSMRHIKNINLFFDHMHGFPP